jgi:hypothetical protein
LKTIAIKIVLMLFDETSYKDTIHLFHFTILTA